MTGCWQYGHVPDSFTSQGTDLPAILTRMLAVPVKRLTPDPPGSSGFDLRPLIRGQNHGDIKHRRLPWDGLFCSRTIENTDNAVYFEARQRLSPGPLAGHRCFSAGPCCWVVCGWRPASLRTSDRSGCTEHPETLRAQSSPLTSTETLSRHFPRCLRPTPSANGALIESRREILGVSELNRDRLLP